MILIHLAKITLLEKSCDYFKNVLIPTLVQGEVLNKKYSDSALINELIGKKKIKVVSIKDSLLLKRAEEFNIFMGEAEVVALYWQENANYLATDDDNVRKKSLLLNLNVIGTPAILLTLYRRKIIDEEKMTMAINKLKQIGWFSNAVLDKILLEVKNG
mgnify:CR=1 FL=1